MRRVSVVLVLLMVLAACRKPAPADPETTVPTAPATTTTTAVSFAVPPTIDAAYIQKVMAALDHVEGDAVRRVLGEGRLDERFVKSLAAIYGPQAGDLAQQNWLKVAGGHFELLTSPPGDPATTVQRIVAAEPTCVVFAARRDFSAMFKKPDPPGPQRYIGLVPLPPERNPDGENPTPWIMSFDGNFTDGAQPTAEEACSL